MNGRIPPHSTDAERGVVGALTLRPDLLSEVLDMGLSPEDFHSPKWGAAFGAVLDLARRGEAVDVLTVGASLEGVEPRPDGADLLSAQASLPSATNVVTYAREVAGCARLRRILAACTEVAEAAYEPKTRRDPAAFCDFVERTVLAATAHSNDTNAPGLLVEVLDAALEELRARSAGRLRGVPTGLADLDAMTGGLRPGQLTVVGARPSVGKSALVLGIALHVAQNVGPVLLCSAEMGRIELGTRALAGGGVPSDRLLSGRLDEKDFERLEHHRDRLMRRPLLIDDAPGTTLGAVRARARREWSREGLAMVVVDYLQLVGGEGRKERRELEVAEVSRGLKGLARELGIPVIAAAQLNRGIELRADKRPVLADLRDSGQVEQDADLVLLLHRPSVYDLDEDPSAASLIVAKHRNGPTGVVPLVWLGHRMAFLDASPPKGAPR